MDGLAGSGPAAGWASGALGAVQAADREIARQTAVRARAVAAFAAARPAAADRPAGTPGAMGEDRRAARPGGLAEVSEWAAQELVLALGISSEAAHTLLERSLVLVHRLPRTLAALESGALHVGHLFPMLERVGPIADDAKRGELEEQLLRWAAGRVTTPAQLAAKARRLGLLVDARDSARRLAEAVRRRGVFARPDREDGMAQMVALLTVPEVAAVLDALGRYADALDEPGDDSTRSQKMADCLVDLVLRPGENDLAPVQAQLTVVAAISTLLGGDEPGEIAGQVVPAELVRALARALGLLPEDGADACGDEPTAGEAGAEHPSPGTHPAEDEPLGADDDAPFGAAPAEDEPPDRPAPSAPDRRRTVAGLDAGDPGVSLLERELETWWREAEDRVLREHRAHPEGAPRPTTSPPWEYVPRHHAGRRQRHGPPTTTDPPPPRPDAGADAAARPVAADSPSAAADAAIAAAGQALLGFDRAVGRASSEVRRAEIATSADEAAWQDSTAGRVSAAADSLQALRDAGSEERAVLARLLATAGDTLVERPRVAVVDALTGALLALTDGRELRRTAACGRPACRRRPARCGHDLTARPGLGPPSATFAYRPGAALDRYLRARTAAAGSPAAADRCRAAGSSTTTGRGRTARPAPRTSSGTAPRTTAASTRRPGGSTGSPVTAR